MSYRSRLVDRLMAHDPALSRVRMGARVTLTILSTVTILIGVHLYLMPLPPISYALAIILSIESGVAIRDRTANAQLATRAMGCCASLLSVSVAIALQDHRVLSDLTFLVVIFAATLARVYGQRGFAIGMFAFTSYFLTGYLKPSFAELPLAALGPLCTLMIGHLIRRFLILDDWRRDLLQAMIAIEGRVDDILLGLAVLSKATASPSADPRELRHLEERMKDVVLMATGLLPRRPEGTDGGDDPVTALAMTIFETHLAAESAIIRSLESPPPFLLVHAIIEQDETLAEKIAKGPSVVSSPRRAASVDAVMWLQRCRKALVAAIGKAQQTHFQGLDSAAPAASPKPDFSWSNPTVRAAVQITIASSIAMVFGLMLSRDRWFWAVLTAYLVFNNTKSRGDQAIRAVQRSVGTLLGVIIGLGVATLLAGHVVASVALATICAFLAFYFLQVSYAILSFFVTIVLCLVYGLIGQLTFDLLLLRVEETLIGSVVGAAVAFFVFPAPTRANVDLALARWYDVLRQLLQAIRNGDGRWQVIDLSTRLDAAYRELTVAARPLGSSWTIVTKPGHIRQTLSIFLAASFWGRNFAHEAVLRAGPPDEEAMKSIDRALAALDEAAALGAECFLQPRFASAPAHRHAAGNSGAEKAGAEMIASLLERLVQR